MSLVELALKKLQESHTARPVNPGSSARAPVDDTVPTVPIPSVEQLPHAAPNPPRPPRSPRLFLNRSALRAAGLLPPEHQAREIADQYRQIKRPLIATAAGIGGAPPVANGCVIMMASALPGEGKTFTSLNLAVSMSRERDVSAVLVDADVAKPHLSRALGVGKEKGLLDLLADETLDPESLILQTDIPGLSFLPAGQHSETATELLASLRMKEIVATMRANDSSRIILLDSPPLLLTTESRVLGEVAGQVVLVVRAGYTAQQAVLDAISLLGEHGGINLVLNQCESTTSEGHYYGHGQIPYGAAADE